MNRRSFFEGAAGALAVAVVATAVPSVAASVTKVPPDAVVIGDGTKMSIDWSAPGIDDFADRLARCFEQLQEAIDVAVPAMQRMVDEYGDALDVDWLEQEAEGMIREQMEITPRTDDHSLRRPGGCCPRW